MGTTIHCTECKRDFSVERPLRVDENLNRNASQEAEQGDTTVCPKCLAVLKLDAGVWRAITDDEWVALSVDERGLVKKAQSVLGRFGRQADRQGPRPKPTDADADMAMEMIAMHVPREMVSSIPWIITRALVNRSEPDIMHTMSRGLSGAARIVTERDTTPMEDLKYLVPIIYAQAHMIQEGDPKKMLEMLDQHIRESAEKHGYKGDISDLLI